MRRLFVAAAATLLFAACAGAARADVATVASDGSTPFDGGADVATPLEQVAGAIASTIAGRIVTVRCEGDGDWAGLADAGRFQPMQVLGYVSFVDGIPADYAELSPDVCRSLQSFAAATTKPTKCTPRPVKQRRVKAVQAAPAVPCFSNGKRLSQSSAFWDGYFETAEALQTLAHESIHLRGDQIEAHAECYGMQYLAFAAQQLGDTPDDATAIARYYATMLYPLRRTQTPGYWSADCRANGVLDASPNDGLWP